MHVGPVTVSQSIDFFEFAMWREIDDFFSDKAETVIILDQVNLLLVVHDEQ